MRSIAPGAQLILFPGADGPGASTAPRPAARRRPSRIERKLAELDRMGAEAEREMADAFRRGDAVTARAAHDRARGARRAAELLRAGPSGVADVLGGRNAAA